MLAAGTVNVSITPKKQMFMDICQKTPSWTRQQLGGGPGFGKGRQVDGRSVQVFEGSCRWGMPVGQVCICWQ